VHIQVQVLCIQRSSRAPAPTVWAGRLASIREARLPPPTMRTRTRPRSPAFPRPPPTIAYSSRASPGDGRVERYAPHVRIHPKRHLERREGPLITIRSLAEAAGNPHRNTRVGIGHVDAVRVDELSSVLD